LRRDDDYRSPGKPPCDWDDPAAKDALVDELVGDAKAALAVSEGEELEGAVAEAVELLATVAGQDVEQREDGTFGIAKKVAKDRIISTVAAPRGALTYPPWSGEGSEVISLGPMADLDSKDEGDNSMPLN